MRWSSQCKCSQYKPYDLSSISGIQVKVERTDPTKISPYLYRWAMMCAAPPQQKIPLKKFFFFKESDANLDSRINLKPACATQQDSV